MNLYVVSYDLIKYETSGSYGKIIEAIQKLGDALEFQKSVWILVSTYSAKEIRDKLKNSIDSGDKLFVGRLNGVASTRLPENIVELIHNARN